MTRRLQWQKDSNDKKAQVTRRPKSQENPNHKKTQKTKKTHKWQENQVTRRPKWKKNQMSGRNMWQEEWVTEKLIRMLPSELNKVYIRYVDAENNLCSFPYALTKVRRGLNA